MSVLGVPFSAGLFAYYVAPSKGRKLTVTKSLLTVTVILDRQLVGMSGREGQGVFWISNCCKRDPAYCEQCT